MYNLQTAIMGDLPAFAADPIRFVEDRAIGPLKPVPLRFGPKSALLVARPSAIREVLVDDRGQYGKGAEQARMRPLFGEGMLTSSGDRWQSSRDTTKGGFSASGLQEGMQIAFDCLGHEAAKLAAQIGHSVDLHTVMGRLAMRMAAAAMFHVRLDDNATKALFDAGSVAFTRLSETMWRLIDLDAILPTQENIKFRAAVKDFEDVVAQFIKNPKGVLGMLGPAAEKHGHGVYRDEAITMLVAGFETTATAACWAAYVLSCRPDLVEWLRTEADAALHSEWGVNQATIHNMPRARAFVQEVLRLYPSAWWFARTALTDRTIDGLSVKKGTSIIICPWALHRQPDLWHSPGVFDPMRFFGKSAPEKFTYIPFGAGPRTCIGMHLAMAELTAITAMLVSAFDLEPLSGPMEELSSFGGVTLGPPADLRVRIGIRPQLRKVA